MRLPLLFQDTYHTPCAVLDVHDCMNILCLRMHYRDLLESPSVPNVMPSLLGPLLQQTPDGPLLAPLALSWHEIAGAIPLAPGDFWHARGALPVAALNSVLREFRDWTQPTLMLVGNHDQAGLPTLRCAHHYLHEPRTMRCRQARQEPGNGMAVCALHSPHAAWLCCMCPACAQFCHARVKQSGGARPQVTLSGLEHGLTPIAEACPAVHVFDRPALCLDALWLPYRRDPAELEACVRSAGPVKAIFGHADVVRVQGVACFKTGHFLMMTSHHQVPGVLIVVGHEHGVLVRAVGRACMIFLLCLMMLFLAVSACFAITR